MIPKGDIDLAKDGRQDGRGVAMVRPQLQNCHASPVLTEMLGQLALEDVAAGGGHPFAVRRPADLGLRSRLAASGAAAGATRRQHHEREPERKPGAADPHPRSRLAQAQGCEAANMLRAAAGTAPPPPPPKVR